MTILIKAIGLPVNFLGKARSGQRNVNGTTTIIIIIMGLTNNGREAEGPSVFGVAVVRQAGRLGYPLAEVQGGSQGCDNGAWELGRGDCCLGLGFSPLLFES